MRPILSVPSLVVAAALTLTGCGNTAAPEAGNSTVTTLTEEQIISSTTERLSASTKKSDEADFGDNRCEVVLGEKIDGEGAAYENGVLSVTKGGVYTISGEIADGMIYVETDENVMLKLNGVSVTNSKGAALYCYSAKNLYIFTEENTENFFSDGTSYDFAGTNQVAEDDEPNAAVYSKDDLILCGSGKLTVKGNYNTGISSKDDLTVESGIIEVTAVNNGIRGKDSLVLEDGEVTVSAGADGIKSANDTDEGKGYLVIQGGKLTVTAGEDGIQSEKELQITGGIVNVTTTGQVAAGGNDMGWGGGFHGNNVDTSSEDDATSKGIKSGTTMLLAGGQITVSSTDHAVHGAAEIIIDGDELNLASSKGKGVSAHGNLTVNNGEIDITQSTEGIESKAVLTVNGGNIHIKASDDGLNAGGGSDSMFGGWGQAAFDGTAHELVINGGYICLNADGDGIDSNGNITVNGGTVLVSGPTNSGNGALDCGDGNYGILVNGGTLIAAGSVGMAEVPSSSSAQRSLAITFNSTLPADTTLCVTDESGNPVVIYTLEKQAQHIVISSPKLTDGMTCNVYTSGTVNGVEADGLYTDDLSFIPDGDPIYTVTVSGSVSYAGNSGGMGGFGGGGMGGGNFGGGHGGRGDDSFGGANGTIPDMSVPDGTMPDMSIPEGQLPDGSMPDFSMPDGMEMPDEMTPPDGTMQGGMTPPDGMTPPSGSSEVTTSEGAQI